MSEASVDSTAATLDVAAKMAMFVIKTLGFPKAAK